jgi:hypothetical protein
MAQEPGLPDIQIDRNSLYREEVFTDRKAGTIRRQVPIMANGAVDAGRAVIYSGQTQLLTPGGVLPLSFEIPGTTLEEAIANFPSAVHQALEHAIEEAREYRREASSRIVVPDVGGMGGGIPGGHDRKCRG